MSTQRHTLRRQVSSAQVEVVDSVPCSNPLEWAALAAGPLREHHEPLPAAPPPWKWLLAARRRQAAGGGSWGIPECFICDPQLLLHPQKPLSLLPDLLTSGQGDQPEKMTRPSKWLPALPY